MFTKMVTSAEKHKSSNRVLVLKPMKDKKALNATGLVDTKLFTGQNKLRAVMDPESSLWRLKYDDGIVPPVFRQRFTKFTDLLEFAKNYFKRRNIEIVEVQD